MIYICENCRYLFLVDVSLNQCPDCGKMSVRPATDSEKAEYERIQLENQEDHWDYM